MPEVGAQNQHHHLVSAFQFLLGNPAQYSDIRVYLTHMHMSVGHLAI